MIKAIKKNAFLIWTLLPAILFLLGFFSVIVFYLVKLAFTHYEAGMATSMGIQNFIEMAESKEFKEAFLRTFYFVIFATPLQLLTGMVTAMLVNKKFLGRGVVRSVFLLPLAIPTIVTTSILLLMFSQGGHISSLLLGQYSFFPKVVNTEIAFISKEPLAIGLSIFGKVWRDTPISMLILLAGLQAISEDQYEAAKTMGASSIQNFFYITLPSMLPAISSVLVLRSIEAWKEFIFPYILAPTFPVLGVLIEKYYIQLQNPSMSAAIGMILIVVILVGTFLLNKLLKYLNNLLVKA
ncbi:sugar ABC transporter permease [Vallitalea pronyensis]|uniref:Sugar ABC transporter permease n=1 Tax=Vallitalea pronyensis TaxID=1348613 RepID=A0A8J8MNG6_9FIRM|nr:sugar ABC transporter permease [Vallitalea pronyensis]QUI24729.1 sugar ABC transporter permease [Vallitalea pronyensis]